MKLLLLLALVFCTISAAAQTLTGLNQTTSFVPVSLPVPCLGSGSECSAHNKASLHNGTHGSYAGTVLAETALNPGKGVEYLRVTDANSGWSANQCFHMGSTGTASENAFDASMTRFMVVECSAGPEPYSFDPVNFTFSKLYGGSYWINVRNGTFSKNTPYKWYSVDISTGDPILYAYNFSSTTTAPTVGNGGVTQIANLATAGSCLGHPFNATWVSDVYVSDDDTTFAVALSNSGGQDTGRYVAVWNTTSGCRWMNTYTGTVGGKWGSTGTNTSSYGGIGAPFPFLVHGLQAGGNLTTLDIEMAQPCPSSPKCPVFSPSLWQVSGLNILFSTTDDSGGHEVMGYTHWVNKIIVQNSLGPDTWFMRNYANMAVSPNAAILDPGVAGISCPPETILCPLDDQHLSWNNNLLSVVGTQDTAPVFTTTYQMRQMTSVPAKPVHFWDNQILALDTSCYIDDTLVNRNSCAGHRPYRIAYTYSDSSLSLGTNFYDVIAIGTISTRPANGYYYFLYTTNWQQQFGCTDGTYAPCTGNARVRGDVVIVRIPTGSSTAAVPLQVTGKSRMAGKVVVK